MMLFHGNISLCIHQPFEGVELNHRLRMPAGMRVTTLNPSIKLLNRGQ